MVTAMPQDASTSDIQPWEATMIEVSRSIMGEPGILMLRQMGIDENRTSPVDFFDNACGSGLLAAAAHKMLPPAVLERSTIFCADLSPALVGLVDRRIKREGWARTGVETLDATKTDLPAGSFSHVGVNFAMHMIPEADAALNDCIRILRPGGHLGLSTMHADNQAWSPDFRSAFASFPFAAPFPDQPPKQTHGNGQWYDPEWVRAELERKGLRDVVVTVLPGKQAIASAGDFVNAFGGMIPMATGWCWDEETRAAHGPDEVKRLMREHLEEKHGGRGWTLDWLFVVATGKIPDT